MIADDCAIVWLNCVGTEWSSALYELVFPKKEMT